jgi:hypothetical protein
MQNTSYREKCKIPVTGNDAKYYLQGTIQILVTGINAK